MLSFYYVYNIQKCNTIQVHPLTIYRCVDRVIAFHCHLPQLKRGQFHSSRSFLDGKQCSFCLQVHFIFRKLKKIHYSPAELSSQNSLTYNCFSKTFDPLMDSSFIRSRVYFYITVLTASTLPSVLKETLISKLH